MKPFYIILGLSAALMAASVSEQSQKTETAVFAGGCFWCLEQPFDSLMGDGLGKLLFHLIAKLF